MQGIDEISKQCVIELLGGAVFVSSEVGTIKGIQQIYTKIVSIELGLL